MVDRALDFSAGLKKPGKQNYMDKTDAVFWSLRADLLFSLAKRKEALDSLHKAKSVARRFDEAPDYSAAAVRFISDTIPATAMDDLGDTAMAGVEQIAAEFEDRELYEAWRKIREEA